MTVKERAAAQEQFIEAFAITSNVLAACQRVGIHRSLVYQWKEHSDTFLAAFNLATADANDRVYGELWRRAMQGDPEYVIAQGKLVMIYDEKLKKTVPLIVYKKSDTLLALLAKARLPEFRDKGIQMNTILPKEYVGFDPNRLEGSED